MLQRTGCVDLIVKSGVMAAARLPSATVAIDTVTALINGGVTVIEFSFTMPHALECISRVVASFGDCVLVGAGTVLDSETARASILAGAQFVVSPTLAMPVIEMAHRYGKAAVPGALTPTEMLAAAEGGADLVKVFPAGVMGPAFISAVLAPLGHVPLMVDGGITLENAGAFIRAGALAVGVGRCLVDVQAIRAGDYSRLTELARSFVAEVHLARQGSSPPNGNPSE
jgi:2-dehydro-3-deoxyphosphogluconate aldolase/(4S)-4-hydroxy-2-oxoglutarate aldolase